MFLRSWKPPHGWCMMGFFLLLKEGLPGRRACIQYRDILFQTSGVTVSLKCWFCRIRRSRVGVLFLVIGLFQVLDIHQLLSRVFHTPESAVSSLCRFHRCRTPTFHSTAKAVPWPRPAYYKWNHAPIHFWRSIVSWLDLDHPVLQNNATKSSYLPISAWACLAFRRRFVRVFVGPSFWNLTWKIHHSSWFCHAWQLWALFFSFASAAKVSALQVLIDPQC